MTWNLCPDVYTSARNSFGKNQINQLRCHDVKLVPLWQSSSLNSVNLIGFNNLMMTAILVTGTGDQWDYMELEMRFLIDYQLKHPH